MDNNAKREFLATTRGNSSVATDTASTLRRLTIRTRILYVSVIVLAATAIALPIVTRSRAQGPPAQSHAKKQKPRNFDAQIAENANELLEDGRQVFRFNTFGDEKFWGDT